MYTLTASYQCQNLYGSSTDTFKLRWFPLFAVFTPLNVWTDEGQPCDYFLQAAPYYRLFACVHTITHCGDYLSPIVRHQSYPDKGRLIQKSPVCWEWASYGEKDEPGFIPALQELTAAARTPSTDEFRESWGEV